MTNNSKHPAREYYPALRGRFGDWIYYSCLMPMGDVTKRLSFAEEIHESKKLSEWIQRHLQSGRSVEISDYLRREPERFFNSLVVAIYRGDPAWHGFSNFRSNFKDIDLTEVSDETEDSVGFLSFTGKEKIFAIDGQHRLAGMREAIKQVRSLGKDQVSLLVVAHRPGKKGRERSRRLFTTLNKTAKSVGKGDIIALDENDVMAIVTRYLVEKDSWFSEDRIKFSQADNVSVGSPELTTIGNLYDVLRVLFPRFKGAKLSELRFIRPPDAELDAYRRFAQKYFRLLAKHFRPLREYFSAPLTESQHIVARERTRNGGHILFRPIGLRMFAEITSRLLVEGKPLEAAIKMLSRIPVELSGSPYREVIWAANGRIESAGRALCRDVLLFMLGANINRKALETRYAKHFGQPRAHVKLPKLLGP